MSAPLPVHRALLLSSLVAFTTVVSMLGWSDLVADDSDFVGPLVVCALVVVAGGAVLRLLGAPALVVAFGQLLLVGATVLRAVTGTAVPGPESFAALSQAVADSIVSAGQYQAPIPASVPSLAPLFLVAGASALVLADLLGPGLRRVGVAGLVWLALYCVPLGFVAAAGSGRFVVGAVGFLCALFVQHSEEVSRWGRAVDTPRATGTGAEASGFAVRTGAVRRSASLLGVGALALALAVPPLVPTLGLGVWDGLGPGGGGRVTLQNPLVDMRRDLSRGEDIPLLRVHAPDSRPSYVRLSVLTRYSGEEWSSGDRDIPEHQVAAGEMPDPPGLSGNLRRRESEFSFSATDDLASRWLPTPSLVSRVEAAGDWRYDRATMDFIARDDDLDTSGLSWTATGIDVAYDAARLDGSLPSSASAGIEMVELPDDMPELVGELTDQVTAEAPTAFRKARALQEWFRTEFDYSLEQVEAVGNSELVSFLSEDGRSGYCEQFASAMAVMARELNIPSRVAVGFLEPRPVGNDLWEFSSHDLHAWPELYFPGSGWVRFEPTPAGRALGVPQYTEADLPRIEEDQAPAAPTRGPDQVPDAPGPEDQVGEESADPTAETSTVPWGRVIGGTLALAGLLALVLAPRLVRRRRRQARLSGQRAEPLWSELRDVATDLGRQWPAGRSPRAVAARLTGWFALPTPDGGPSRVGPLENLNAVRALERLVTAVEQERYAESAGTSPIEELRRDLEQCEEALAAGVAARQRRRARWLPASVLTGAAQAPTWSGPDRELSRQ